MGGTGKGTKILQPAKISQVTKFCKPAIFAGGCENSQNLYGRLLHMRQKMHSKFQEKKFLFYLFLFLFYFLLFKKIVFKNFIYIYIKKNLVFKIC